MKRRLIIIGIIILLAAGAGFWVWQKYQADLVVVDNLIVTKEDERKFLEPLAREQKEREEAYKKDAYGGKTPEETLKLYLDAQRAKNIELASRYYLIEDQQEERRILENLLKEDAVSYNRWAGFMAKAKKVKEEGDRASFEYEYELTYEVVDSEFPNIKIPPGTYTNTISFVKLPSGVWKIKSP